MSGNKKIEEGLEHIKNAEKCLKTSLLKWRPDFDQAGDEYNKAATCFRNAKSWEQCKDCLMKAADSYKQNRGFFYAAKAYDQAILVCKEMGKIEEIYPLVDKTATLFQNQGNGESAISSLDKAGKILEAQRPEEALKCFQRAAEIASIQDSQRQAAEYLGKVARIHVKLQEYDLAADAIRREIGIHQECESYQAAGRLAVALVLVQLARGDLVAAEKAFKEWGNCCEGPEVQTLEMLLQAYDEEDPENAKRALNSPFIKHMDVEYAILARDMPLPQGMSVPQKATVRENAAPSYVSPNFQSKTDETGDAIPPEPKETSEDELEEGGLC